MKTFAASHFSAPLSPSDEEHHDLLNPRSMTKIYLYAEVLTNIRQVTLYASLQTTKNKETKIDLSSDKKVITVHHDGESSSIYLPTQISGTAAITIPAERAKELSVRLEIEDVSELRPADEDLRGVEVPWSADGLTSETSMFCKACQSSILGPGRVKVWKDMPSENWAEMMDFWHCHKPHEEGAEHGGHAAHERVLCDEQDGRL